MQQLPLVLFWHEIDTLVNRHMTRFIDTEPQRTQHDYAREGSASVTFTIGGNISMQFLVQRQSSIFEENTACTWTVQLTMGVQSRRLNMFFFGQKIDTEEELRCDDLKWDKSGEIKVGDYSRDYPEDRFTQMVPKMLRLLALNYPVNIFCCQGDYTSDSRPEYIGKDDDCFQIFIYKRTNHRFNTKLRLYIAQDPSIDDDAICRVLFFEPFCFSVTALPVAIDPPLRVTNSNALIKFMASALQQYTLHVDPFSETPYELLCQLYATSQTVSWFSVYKSYWALSPLILRSG